MPAIRHNSLRPQQLAFVDAYLETSNGTKAAIAAGYSAKTAHVQASQLLKHPLVAAELDRRRQKLENKSSFSAARIMQELASIAFLDPATMYDEFGQLLPINKMPEETRRAIAGIEQKKDFIKLRTSSKLDSLHLAAKILGMVKAEENNSAVQIVINEKPQVTLPTLEAPKMLPDLTE